MGGGYFLFCILFDVFFLVSSLSLGLGGFWSVVVVLFCFFFWGGVDLVFLLDEQLPSKMGLQKKCSKLTEANPCYHLFVTCFEYLDLKACFQRRTTVPQKWVGLCIHSSRVL